jgi:hypothetical protein
MPTQVRHCSRPLCGSGDTGVHLHSVTAAIAKGKHPVPSRTRKLSPSAPMVLRGRPRGRVGHRRTCFHKAREPLPGNGSSGSRAFSARPGQAWACPLFLFRGAAGTVPGVRGDRPGTSTFPGKGGGPRKVARARPALGSPSDPEVAQEPVGVLQRCRAGKRVAGGGRVRRGGGAGRVPVQ